MAVFGMQEGQALVTWPKAYAAQVQSLLTEWAARYKTLQQWQGPHKFEDTPVGKLLAQEGVDPRVRQYRSLPCSCQDRA